MGIYWCETALDAALTIIKWSIKHIYFFQPFRFAKHQFVRTDYFQAIFYAANIQYRLVKTKKRKVKYSFTQNKCFPFYQFLSLIFWNDKFIVMFNFGPHFIFLRSKKRYLVRSSDVIAIHCIRFDRMPKMFECSLFACSLCLQKNVYFCFSNFISWIASRCEEWEKRQLFIVHCDYIHATRQLMQIDHNFI